MEVKGEKRFIVKDEALMEPSKNTVLDLKTQDFEKKKELFRRMNFMTSYSINFGERPRMTEDQEILRYKKLSDLLISKILKPQAIQFFEKWLEVNEKNELTSKLYLTLRNMYTRVFNNIATISTKDEAFTWPKTEIDAKPPRYDKLIDQVKSTVKPKKTLQITKT